MNEKTSAAVAAIAARGLAHPESLTATEIKRICASALTQREAMQKFVTRVDNKEIHSRRTYAEFKEIFADDDQHTPEGS
jgi:hypothetical protein